jgi:hypothetical protein
MARFVLIYHDGDTPEEPTQETMNSWITPGGASQQEAVRIRRPATRSSKPLTSRRRGRWPEAVPDSPAVVR